MKLRNSPRRRRFSSAAVALPVATSKAAKSVEAPLRLYLKVWICFDGHRPMKSQLSIHLLAATPGSQPGGGERSAFVKDRLRASLRTPYGTVIDNGGSAAPIIAAER